MSIAFLPMHGSYLLLMKVRNDGSNMPDLSYDLVADLHPDREEVDVKGSVFYSA
jgi:hypothetical protein